MGKETNRKEQLYKIFENVEENKRNIILPLIDEVLFIEEELNKLKKLPLIRIHPSNPARQETTPAGKMYKEYMQSYLNALKVLQKTLYMEGVSGDSPLMKVLEAFDQNE